MSDLGNANWSEVDASNNAANPNGWPGGMAANQVEPTARAGMGATKRWYNKINAVYTTGGTSTAYTITSSGAAEAQYYTGQLYTFIANATCGDSPTINYDSLGAIALRKFTAGAYAACRAGDIQASQIVVTRYNGTQFDILVMSFNYTDFITNGGSPTFVTQTAGDNSTKAATTAYVDLLRVSAARVTNSLGSDVAINSANTYFDGPSVAQGSTGTWFVSGTVTVSGQSGGTVLNAKLWDGTTVIASTVCVTVSSGSAQTTLSLSGMLTSPAANLRISVANTSDTNGSIKFNLSGNSKDSTITAIRIA